MEGQPLEGGASWPRSSIFKKNKVGRYGGERGLETPTIIEVRAGGCQPEMPAKTGDTGGRIECRKKKKPWKKMAALGRSRPKV